MLEKNHPVQLRTLKNRNKIKETRIIKQETNLIRIEMSCLLLFAN